MSQSLEKLDTAGGELIDKVGASAEKLLAFVERETPQLMGELILYRKVQCSLWSCVALLIALAGLYALWRLYRWGATFDLDKCDDWVPVCLVASLASGLCAILGFIAALYWLAGLIKVCVAPRVYLLEYFADFVR